MELNRLLDVAIQASKEAGDAILEYYVGTVHQTTKEDGSPLTLADKAAHNVILKELAKTGIPVVSEEGNDLLMDADLYWLVDPLDGTKDFLAKNDEFTVNIALISGTRPLLGVVYGPGNSELYAGIPDASLLIYESKGIRSDVGQFKKSEKIKMGVSRFHDHEDVDVFAEMNNIESKTKIGSALKYGQLAVGLIDVFPRLVGSSEWDTAAGQAVVESAGGSVLNWNTGKTLTYGKSKRRNPRLISFRAPYKFSDFKLKSYKDELL